MRCPRCGSRTLVYKKILDVRYRKCRRCRLNIVTVEVERYVLDTLVDAARAAGLDVDRLNRIIREGVIEDA